MRFWLAGLFLCITSAHAGNQAEERLADSVRVLLRQSVAAQMPHLRPFTSTADERQFYRWRTLMSERLARYVPSADVRIDMLNAIDYEARRAGLEPALVLGVIEVESHFKPQATSLVGARGLMQVMPFWAQVIGDGSVQKLQQMRFNVRFGCVILRHYLDKEKGDLVRALGRYNGSLGRTGYAFKVLKAAQHWR
jgi:soluble lytic murein transglycosylase-like protein